MQSERRASGSSAFKEWMNRMSCTRVKFWFGFGNAAPEKRKTRMQTKEQERENSGQTKHRKQPKNQAGQPEDQWKTISQRIARDRKTKKRQESDIIRIGTRQNS